MNFEEYLQMEHQKEYVGSKDNAQESFIRWLEDFEIDTWLEYAERWCAERCV